MPRIQKKPRGRPKLSDAVLDTRKKRGDRLREALHRLGVTQTAAGQKSGVPQAHISEMIKGKREIRLDHIELFSDKLDISADFILGRNVHADWRSRAPIGAIADQFRSMLLVHESGDWQDDMARRASGIAPPEDMSIVDEAAQLWWRERLREAANQWRDALLSLESRIADDIRMCTVMLRLSGGDRRRAYDVVEKLARDMRLEADELTATKHWSKLASRYGLAHLRTMAFGGLRALAGSRDGQPLFTQRKVREWFTREAVPGGIGFAITDETTCHVWSLAPKSLEVLARSGHPTDLLEMKETEYHLDVLPSEGLTPLVAFVDSAGNALEASVSQDELPY